MKNTPIIENEELSGPQLEPILILRVAQQCIKLGRGGVPLFNTGKVRGDSSAICVIPSDLSQESMFGVVGEGWESSGWLDADPFISAGMGIDACFAKTLVGLSVFRVELQCCSEAVDQRALSARAISVGQHVECL